jgi:hypothetical protein
MVTGSQATIVYGEPRFTNDIDIVADLNAESLPAFCDAFPDDDFYLNRSAAQDAVNSYGMFNIIHPRSGLKVDVIIPKPSSFDQVRLARAKPIQLRQGFVARFTTPEDIILKKLEWQAMGGGERHLRDIVGVLKICGETLDYKYMQSHASQLGVLEVWEELLHRYRHRKADHS